MKALLSIVYACVFALTPGVCRATPTDEDLPKAEVTLNTPAAGSTPPVPTESAAAKSPAPPKSTPAPSAPVSENVTINLINRLVQRGALSQEDADELIKQAEIDAVKARAQAAAANRTPPEQPPAPDNSPFRPTITVPPTESLPPPPASIPPPADADDDVRVTYVPETVRRQIADEVRQKVMQQARDENWANPRTLPGWTLRLTPFADLRLRYEGLFFPDGNDNTGAFPNFNAINTGAPFDTTGTTFSPQNIVDKDRNRIRIRVRFGAQMDLEDGFSFGIRIATGETSNPVSANQTFGYANGGQGGNFSKSI